MQHMQITIELRSGPTEVLIWGDLMEPSRVPRQSEHNHSQKDGEAVQDK